MLQAALGFLSASVNSYYLALVIFIICQVLLVRFAISLYLFYLFAKFFLKWGENAKKAPRTAIYIDGSNFYHLLKETDFSSEQREKKGAVADKPFFRHDKQFNFAAFMTYLCDQKECVIRKYHIGSIALNTQEGVDAEAVKNLAWDQEQHFILLRKHGLEVVESILQFDGPRFKEKGVDTRLALEMYNDAIEDRYDEAILISSDNDFIPAIQFAQRKGKKVTIVGFSYRPPHALIKEADYEILVDANALRQYIQF